MGLLSRKPKPPRLPRAYDFGFTDNEYSASSLADALVQVAEANAGAAYATVRRHGDSWDDLGAVSEALESVLVIAQKMKQIDQTLRSSSAGQLSDVLTKYERTNGKIDLRPSYTAQEQLIEEFIEDRPSRAQKQWYEKMLELRGQVFQHLAYANDQVLAMREDIAFISTARKSQDLLPGFALDDIEATTRTAEDAAAKTRELAETTAGLAVPPKLSELGAAAAERPATDGRSVTHDVLGT